MKYTHKGKTPQNKTQGAFQNEHFWQKIRALNVAYKKVSSLAQKDVKLCKQSETLVSKHKPSHTPWLE